MDSFLDELAEIYFTSPKNEKKRLKKLFNKAFRAAKKHTSIESQHPHLEYQVHLRTLLCFGVIHNLHRKNRWKFIIPKDIKLLITLYYPDVFKAPIGVYLGYGFQPLLEIGDLFDEHEVEPISRFHHSHWTADTNWVNIFDITEAEFTPSTTDVVHHSNAIHQTLFNISDASSYDIMDNMVELNTMNSSYEPQSVLDLFDIDGCCVSLINGIDNGLKAIGLRKQQSIIKFEDNGHDMRYKDMQIMLSRKASMDDVFCNKLGEFKHLFEMKTVETGMHKSGISTKHVFVQCFDYVIQQILQCILSYVNLSCQLFHSDVNCPKVMSNCPKVMSNCPKVMSNCPKVMSK